jgi:hypothetical protein
MRPFCICLSFTLLPQDAAEGAFFKKKGSEAVVIKQKFSLLTFLSHSIVIFVKF